MGFVDAVIKKVEMHVQIYRDLKAPSSCKGPRTSQPGARYLFQAVARVPFRWSLVSALARTEPEALCHLRMEVLSDLRG